MLIKAIVRNMKMVISKLEEKGILKITFMDAPLPDDHKITKDELEVYRAYRNSTLVLENRNTIKDVIDYLMLKYCNLFFCYMFAFCAVSGISLCIIGLFLFSDTCTSVIFPFVLSPLGFIVFFISFVYFIQLIRLFVERKIKLHIEIE